jgi:adenylate kinase
MRMILIGPPGSGKGTQAHWISQRYSIPHISTGDMLRKAIQNNLPLSLSAKQLIDQGKLVPDATMIKVLNSRLAEPDCDTGFVLDGFPRTLPQAVMLKTTQKSPIDSIVELVVPNATIIKRFSGRRIHPTSGRIYHTDYQPPRMADQDDLTGEPLVQRTDDQPAIIQKRLTIYETQIKPLKSFYQAWINTQDPFAPQWFSVAADIPISQLRNQLAQFIDA